VTFHSTPWFKRFHILKPRSSCLKNGLETLVGAANMHIFRFFVDSSNWHVMLYKISPTYNVYSPMDGPPIKFWKITPNGSLKLPIRILSLVLYCPILGHDALRSVQKEKFINVELSKYIEFWK
jgi:hypothetical protein